MTRATRVLAIAGASDTMAKISIRAVQVMLLIAYLRVMIVPEVIAINQLFQLTEPK